MNKKEKKKNNRKSGKIFSWLTKSSVLRLRAWCLLLITEMANKMSILHEEHAVCSMFFLHASGGQTLCTIRFVSQTKIFVWPKIVAKKMKKEKKNNGGD